MALVNIIRTGANGFRRMSRSASAFIGNGANSKTHLALPSPRPKQSEHKLGYDETKNGEVLALIGASLSGLFVCATVAYCDEAVHGSVCPWPNRDVLSSSDPPLISTGKRAFQNSCAACHANLSLVAKSCSDTVAKAVVTQIEVADDHRDMGVMLKNTAMQKDQIPSPYANKNGPIFANGGAYFPDIAKISEVMRYNPYYSGGAISMLKMLGSSVEYATPACISVPGGKRSCQIVV